jgi:hypothetical protein
VYSCVPHKESAARSPNPLSSPPPVRGCVPRCNVALSRALLEPSSGGWPTAWVVHTRQVATLRRSMHRYRVYGGRVRRRSAVRPLAVIQWTQCLADAPLLVSSSSLTHPSRLSNPSVFSGRPDGLRYVPMESTSRQPPSVPAYAFQAHHLIAGELWAWSELLFPAFHPCCKRVESSSVHRVDAKSGIQPATGLWIHRQSIGWAPSSFRFSNPIPPACEFSS